MNVADTLQESVAQPIRLPAADYGARSARAETPALILAGVHAWGQNALDNLGARPLLPVGDRPLVAHILTWLHRAGIRRVSVCANSETSALRRSLGDGGAWGVELDYYEDVFPRGPAGCVVDALACRRVPACIVVEGTILPDIELDTLLAVHRDTHAALTVAAADPDGVSGESAPGLRPLGIYVFSPQALEDVPSSGYQDIKETLIPRLYAHGRNVAIHVAPAHEALRVMDVDSYMTATRTVLRRLADGTTTLPGYRTVGEAQVHESARLDPTARLIGPVMIGAGSEVESGALVSGLTCVGAGCTIGRSAIVSRSVVWDRCVISRGALVDQCVLPDETWVAPGNVLRNTLRGDATSRLPTFWKRLASAAGYRP